MVTGHGFSRYYWPEHDVDDAIPPVSSNHTWLTSLNDSVLVYDHDGQVGFYANAMACIVEWQGGWLIAETLAAGKAAATRWNTKYLTDPRAAVIGLHNEGFPTRVRDNRIGYRSVGPSGHYYPGGVIYPTEYAVELGFTDGLSHWGPAKSGSSPEAQPVDPYFNLETLPQSALYSMPFTKLEVKNSTGGSLNITPHTFNTVGQVLQIHDAKFIAIGDSWWDRVAGGLDLNEINVLSIDSSITSQNFTSKYMDVDNVYEDRTLPDYGDVSGVVATYIWPVDTVWTIDGTVQDDYWVAAPVSEHGKLVPALTKDTYTYTGSGAGALALTYNVYNEHTFAIYEKTNNWYIGYDMELDGWLTPLSIDARYKILNWLVTSKAPAQDWSTEYVGVDNGDPLPNIVYQLGEFYRATLRDYEADSYFYWDEAAYDAGEPVDYTNVVRDDLIALDTGFLEANYALAATNRPSAGWLSIYGKSVITGSVAGLPAWQQGAADGGPLGYAVAVSNVYGTIMSLKQWSQGRLDNTPHASIIDGSWFDSASVGFTETGNKYSDPYVDIYEHRHSESIGPAGVGDLAARCYLYETAYGVGDALRTPVAGVWANASVGTIYTRQLTGQARLYAASSYTSEVPRQVDWTKLPVEQIFGPGSLKTISVINYPYPGPGTVDFTSTAKDYIFNYFVTLGEIPNPWATWPILPVISSSPTAAFRFGVTGDYLPYKTIAGPANYPGSAVEPPNRQFLRPQGWQQLSSQPLTGAGLTETVSFNVAMDISDSPTKDYGTGHPSSGYDVGCAITHSYDHFDELARSQNGSHGPGDNTWQNTFGLYPYSYEVTNVIVVVDWDFEYHD
jgi:hypothetical protein